MVVVGGLVAVGAVFWLLGRYYPGSGLEQIGQRSARELAERREALEAEDLDQMLAAHNERRRARGEAELTAERSRPGSCASCPSSSGATRVEHRWLAA